MNPKFKGQYADETLLLKKHENIISFSLAKIYIVIIYLVLATAIYAVSRYIFEMTSLGIIGAVIILLWWLFYLRYQYTNTWMVITDKRVLKLVKSSLFVDHRRELKLVDIKATLVRRNICNILFGYGTIEVQGTDMDSHVYFRGVRHHEDIVNYLSKIIDIAKNHPERLSEVKVYKDRIDGRY